MMPETTVVVPSQHSMLSCGPNRFNRELTHFAEIKIPEKPIENLLIPYSWSSRHHARMTSCKRSI